MVCESSSRNTFMFFSAFSLDDMVCVSIPIYDTLISKLPLGTFILNFPSMSAEVPVSSLPLTYMAMLAPGRISPVAFSYTAPSTVTTSFAWLTACTDTSAELTALVPVPVAHIREQGSALPAAAIAATRQIRIMAFPPVFLSFSLFIGLKNEKEFPTLAFDNRRELLD